MALLVGMYLSLPLWIGPRTYPQAPLVNFVEPLLPLVEQVLLAIFALLALVSILFTRLRGVLFIASCLLFLVAVQDMNRWQPWVFQYFTIMVMLLPLASNYKKYLQNEHLLFGIQICLALVYFYSGMFKINPGFAETIVPNYTNPITKYLWSHKELVYSIASLTPYAEMALAIALFIPKIRNWTVIAITLLHLCILYLFGPFGGLNTNTIIWPWNATLILLIWLAFYKVKNFNFNFQFGKLNVATKLFVIAISTLPILNWWHLYNHGLSYELYSGRTYVTHFKFHVKQVEQSPPQLDKYMVRYGDSIYVRTFNWANAEFGTPPNPDVKVLKATESKVLKMLQKDH